jgi:3-phytase
VPHLIRPVASLCLAAMVGACAADFGDTERPTASGTLPDDRPSGAAMRPLRAGTYSVAAVAETAPVPHDGDAADDPAIWVDPADPSRSLIIGTDKKPGGGLAIYNLAGEEVAFQAVGATNNVDIRGHIVVGGNEADNEISVYRLDPSAPRLVPVGGQPIRPNLTIYGTCLYRSATDGRLFAFVTSERGEVEQWELVEDEEGSFTGRRVRQFELASQTEACVADDAAGTVYFAEESTGIWRFPAQPDAEADGQLIDRTGSGHLTADVEGLAHADDFLIASSQGDDRYVVYRLEDGGYVADFRIDDSDGIDEVTDTDGLEVTTSDLGGAFGDGLLVVQDGQNGEERQNFKLVPLASLFD